MTNYDDIQLDEETLRQIEKEARIEAETELTTNEALMKEIEAEALREISVDSVELDDQFLEDLIAELSTATDLKINITDLSLEELDLDLSDVDLSGVQDDETVIREGSVHAPDRNGPSAPLVAENAEDLVLQAQSKVKQKVRNRMVKAAAEKLREKTNTASKVSSIEAIEADIQNKKGISKVIIIVILLLAICVVAGTAMILFRGNSPEKPSSTPLNGSTTTVNQPSGTGDEPVEALTLLRFVQNVGKRGYQTLDHFNTAKKNIATLRRDYPDFASKHEETLKEREQMIDEKLAWYKSMGY